MHEKDSSLSLAISGNGVGGCKDSHIFMFFNMSRLCCAHSLSSQRKSFEMNRYMLINVLLCYF